MPSAATVHDPARVAEEQGIVTPCRDPRFRPSAWHPDGQSIGGQEAARAAKNLCAYSCPVRVICRDWALAHAERYGIWGGLTEAERRTLRRGGRPRDVRARWLAGLTDHAGDPLPTPAEAPALDVATPAA